jgi:uncharacterized protein (DUF1499 family)
MNSRLLLLAITTTMAMAGCSNADSENAMVADRSLQTCGDKPNCVSTRDKRDDFQLAKFTLNETGLAHWADIEQIALSLSGASLAKKPLITFTLNAVVLSLVLWMILNYAFKAMKSLFDLNREQAILILV